MSKRGLSDKEAEILAKQRRVAAKLSVNATASKACTTAKPPPPPSNKQAALLQSKLQREQVKQVLKRPSIKKATQAPPPQKRPTLKVKSAQAALQAARAKLGADRVKAVASRPVSDANLQRKTNSKSLSNLITASISTSTQADSDGGGGNYGHVEPDDFWRNVRDWDFISQYAKQQSNSKHTGPTRQPKPLPDKFINHRHYIASWAPLCLAEARAQLLSECMTNSHRNSFVNVSLKTNPKSLGTALDSLTVVVKLPQHSNEGKIHFFANDACLLVPEHHLAAVQHVLKKGDIETSYRSHGLVGHTEHSRKSLDGLQLKVNKKWWAKVSQGENWGLLKIGCNVTALREFTALCRVEMIPLKRYLLCQHLESAAVASKAANSTTKAQLLNKMGGTQALGKGFTKYAQKKFNPSQLQAISASAADYGAGGFTLIKGPPGTGKTTTLVAILNSLHIRQFNRYYDELREIAKKQAAGNSRTKLSAAVRAKPRLLVCAPSNAAVDNVILKIMEDGFVDGSGQRYNPSMIRVGVGQSATVKDVALENQVNAILADRLDLGKVETSIAGYKMEIQRISSDIAKLRKRVHALSAAAPWPLSKDWEIRVDEVTFETTGRVYFVNHKSKTTSYECPPPPEPDEMQYEATAMPEYRSYMAKIVKLYEGYNSISTKLDRCKLIRAGMNGNNNQQIRMDLETHVLDNVHIVMTTLGTAGNRVLEAAEKFEVIVIDEAAQSVEPSTLSALQLGSKHAILVGDPQQLPATIFNVSGRGTKYDRSLFQRLEEAGQDIFMLNQQYRMNPKISHFPREIFYGGDLKDGPNVMDPNYGNPLHDKILTSVPAFQPLTVLDLDSKEERGGSSYANSCEAHLAVHLYCQLRDLTSGLSTSSRVAIITPYSQQAGLLRRTFQELLGPQYANFVEVNTVDAFQGREANIVIFSCVRAAGSKGIGFLSDVRRMNVALTRAKHFLLVIARCKSIVVNPYWNDLVKHARGNNAVVDVPYSKAGSRHTFPELHSLKVPGMGIGTTGKSMKPNDPRNPNKNDPRKNMRVLKNAPAAVPASDPRSRLTPPLPPPPPPPPANDPRGKPSIDKFMATDPRKSKPGKDPRKDKRGYGM